MIDTPQISDIINEVVTYFGQQPNQSGQYRLCGVAFSFDAEKDLFRLEKPGKDPVLMGPSARDIIEQLKLLAAA